VSLLRGKLHLPRRAPAAEAPGAAAGGAEPAADRADVALRVVDGGMIPAAESNDVAAEVAAPDADAVPPEPTPIRPVPVRSAAAKPPARSRKKKAPPAVEVVAEEPPVVEVVAEEPPVEHLPDEPPALADEPPTLAAEPPAVAAAPDRPLRIVLVEEVPEVVAHVREMLRGQPSLRLVEVIADGRRVANEVRELRADVVVVDSLLQGRVTGLGVIERLRSALPGLGVVALGIPGDTDLADQVRSAADAVVALPFGTIDLARAIRDAHDARAVHDPARSSRVVAVYAAKGGVGKTTLALNLAVGLAAAGVRTALLDGSLQYGDMRRLLRVDPAEPSICDLPTDCVRASDLVGAMRRGPAGVDILFAPPRLEMADMVTARDLDKILDLLRRTYQAVIVDTPSALNDTTLTVLDMADVILQVLTPEPAALDSTRAAAAAFAAIGYPAEKVRVVINRADAQGGLRADQLRRALGHDPDHLVASDWQLVSAANLDAVPFVIARPEAKVSRDVLALGGAVMAVVGAPPSQLPVRLRTRARPRTRAG
jgi:pilus assembly protein CpaE